MLLEAHKPNCLQKMPSIHNVPSSHGSFLITASKINSRSGQIYVLKIKSTRIALARADADA